MKRIYALFGLFILTSCVDPNYQPKLSSPPKDSTKYESDRKYCIKSGEDRWEKARQEYVRSGRTVMPFAFGVAGAAVDVAVHKDDPITDYTKPITQLVDECMVARGYNIKL